MSAPDPAPQLSMDESVFAAWMASRREQSPSEFSSSSSVSTVIVAAEAGVGKRKINAKIKVNALIGTLRRPPWAMLTLSFFWASAAD
jgi:hypothetical protein